MDHHFEPMIRGRVCDKPYQEKPEHDLLFQFSHPQQLTNKKVVGVVLCIHHGQAYEKKYHKWRQETQSEDQVILVGTVMGLKFKKIASMFHGCPEDEKYKFLWKIMNQVPKQKVLVNFEHSSGFCFGNFREEKAQVYQIIKTCKSKGFSMRFSGYAVACLLNDWDESILGPCEFKEMKYHEEKPLQLKVNRQAFLNSHSKFHRAMGEIMTADVVILGPEDSFSLFCRKPGVSSKDYGTKFLTVNVTYPAQYSDENIQIQGTSGSIGHALLEYSNGFKIFLSSSALAQTLIIPVNKQTLNKAYGKYVGEKRRCELMIALNKLEDSQKSLGPEVQNFLNGLPLF